MKKLILLLTALAMSLTIAASSAQARLGFSKEECDALYKSEGIDTSTETHAFAPGMAFVYTVGDVFVTVILKNDRAVGVFYVKGDGTFTEAEYQALLGKNGILPDELREVGNNDYDRYWKHDPNDLELSNGNGIHILRDATATTSRIMIYTREGHDFVWSYLKNKTKDEVKDL